MAECKYDYEVSTNNYHCKRKTFLCPYPQAKITAVGGLNFGKCDIPPAKKRTVKVKIKAWAFITTKLDGKKWVPNATFFRFNRNQKPCTLTIEAKYLKEKTNEKEKR